MTSVSELISFIGILAQDAAAAPAAGPSTFMKIIENSIWAGIAACAAGGMYAGLLLVRRVKQKQFPGAASEQAFLTELTECLERRDFDAALQVCDNPALWNKALAQLAAIRFRPGTCR